MSDNIFHLSAGELADFAIVGSSLNSSVVAPNEYGLVSQSVFTAMRLLRCFSLSFDELDKMTWIRFPSRHQFVDLADEDLLLLLLHHGFTHQHDRLRGPQHPLPLPLQPHHHKEVATPQDDLTQVIFQIQGMLHIA